MLFSYTSYAAASVRKQNACERYKASQRTRSGQRLYENFMRTKGRRAQDTKVECVRNILDLQCYFLSSKLSLKHFRRREALQAQTQAITFYDIHIACGGTDIIWVFMFKCNKLPSGANGLAWTKFLGDEHRNPVCVYRNILETFIMLT